MLVHDFDAAALVAVRLVNSFDAHEIPPERLPTPNALRAFLRTNGVAATSVGIRELREVQGLRDMVRPLFEPRSLSAKARILNELLAEAPVRPVVIARRGDDWIQAVDVDERVGIARRLAVVCGCGLADVIGRYGSGRLKVCEATPCKNVFIDLSKNLVRRHCSRRCANRTSAAAFRARQRPAVPR
jgi:predicted RNA-binding Zn ribbon-like protein